MSFGMRGVIAACVAALNLIWTGPVLGGVKAESKPPAKRAGSAVALQQTDESVRSESFQYAISQLPDFVVRLPDPDARIQFAHDVTDVQVMLMDRQISLLGAEPVEYVRIAFRPLNSQGVQAASQLHLGFIPAYQRLTLHRIRVMRDGKTLDLTRAVKLDLLRREKNLESNLFEGEVTALAVLPDVRVGDVVDYEYSVGGSNPIFGKRYATRLNISRPFPVDALHLRLLVPDKRAIQVRTSTGVSIEQSVKGGIRQYEVTRKAVAPVIEEAEQPLWYDPGLRVEISEYADWAEVQKWAEELFRQSDQLSPQIQQQLAKWRDAQLPPQQLVGEVLRWVQGEVRYFGIELGMNSHLPVHPNLTMERRFGDCKDKSLLLATMLNQLGVQAQPALASIKYQRAVGAALPSPAVFDHAIVKVMLDGKTWWLDATRPPQFGTLASIGAYDFGKVLVLGDGTTGLQDAGYPPGYIERQPGVDRYILKSLRDPVELVSEATYSGGSAESVRQAIAVLPKDELAKRVRAFLLRLLPTATAQGDIEIQDDQAGNRVTLTARYRIDDLFRYEPGKLTADIPVTVLLSNLNTPQIPQRNAPFSLPYTMRFAQSIIVELPDNPIRNVPEDEANRGTYWSLRTHYRSDKDRFEVDYALQANKETVPASAMPAFIDETLGLRRKTTLTATLRVAELSEQDRRKLSQSLSRYDHFGKTRSDGVNAEIGAHVDSLQITRDIASGKLTDRQLAQAYSLRAVAWDNLGEVEAALKDIRAAVDLMPGNAEYRFTYGTILLGAGQAGEALQVFERAAQLSADKIDAFHQRLMGVALHYLGREREAVVQLTQSFDASDGEAALYSALWQHLAAKRSHAASSVLESQLDRVMVRTWPYPVAEMLLGRVSPDQLLVRAESDDKGMQRDRLCEAYFYIGQKYLLDGQKEQARSAFEKSAAQEVFPFGEYGYALHELGRVKAPRREKSWFEF